MVIDIGASLRITDALGTGSLPRTVLYRRPRRSWVGLFWI